MLLGGVASKYSAPGVRCYPGMVLKLILYRVLISLTVKDSKTFFKRSSESKMPDMNHF